LVLPDIAAVIDGEALLKKFPDPEPNVPVLLVTEVLTGKHSGVEIAIPQLAAL